MLMKKKSVLNKFYLLAPETSTMIKNIGVIICVIVFLFLSGVCFGKSSEFSLPNGNKLIVKNIAYGSSTDDYSGGQIFYKGKLIFKHELSLYVDKYFTLPGETVVLVETVSGGSTCYDEPKVLIRIDRNDRVLVTKEFANCEGFDKVSQEGNKIVFQARVNRKNKYYTYMNGSLSVKSSDPYAGIKGKVLSGGELINKFRRKIAYDILGDPDFKTSIKAKLKISDVALKNLEQAMSASSESEMHNGDLIIEGWMDHAAMYYSNIRISKDGKISCFASLMDGFRFYTNDPKFANSVDLSLAPNSAASHGAIPDTTSIKHYYNGNKRSINSKPINPCGELYEVYKVPSQYTDLQREEYLKSLVGRPVHWKLQLYEVSRSGSGFKISTSTPSCLGVFLDIENPKPGDFNYLMQKKTGNWIEFEGVISDTFLRNFEIKQGRLIY